MDPHFNFLQLPVLSALTDAAQLLPGLKQVNLIYHEPEHHLLQIINIKNNDTKKQEIINYDVNKTDDIVRFANSIKGGKWYEESELPYSAKVSNKPNSIFNEISRSVLCIGFNNSESVNTDVFIFYFKDDASEFGPMHRDKVLETTQKIVIERLLQTSLKAIINNYRQNQTAMFTFNKSIQSLLYAKQKKIKEQEQKIVNQRKDMDALIEGLLKGMKGIHEEIVITDAAKSILRSYLYDISIIRNAITKALNFVRTISFGLPQKEMILNEDFFIELKQNKFVADTVEKNQVDEYSADTKIFKFLDSLEKAVQDLSIKGMKLTSSNVGSVLPQPITAAAISDKLKNHRRKINLLLRQYPKHWEMIRIKFRPIVNIQERYSDTKVA